MEAIQLNHPETTPPFHGKLPFTKLVPGAKKVGDCCTRIDKANQMNHQVYTLHSYRNCGGNPSPFVEEKN